jgi:MraZ protein
MVGRLFCIVLLLCAQVGIAAPMFLGQFVHTLDSKGRLTIPAKFRVHLDATLVVTRWMDRCLAVFPMAEWERLSARVSNLPMTDRRARALKRFLFSSASHVSPDNQGRVLIPPRLREYAGLDGEVVVAGLNEYMEIWGTDAWGDERERVEGDDADMDGWAALGI